ncbi:hypothetical protein ABZP36_009818 [Zizania latifolia]
MKRCVPCLQLKMLDSQKSPVHKRDHINDALDSVRMNHSFLKSLCELAPSPLGVSPLWINIEHHHPNRSQPNPKVHPSTLPPIIPASVSTRQWRIIYIMFHIIAELQ